MNIKSIKKSNVFSFLGPIVFLSINLLGCSQSYYLPEQDPEDYVQLYMPQARLDPALRELAISEEQQVIIYGAYLGGVHSAQDDIVVQFTLDSVAMEVYNAAHGTAYTILPENSYSLSATEAVIPAGEFSTPAQRIIFHTTGPDAMEPFKSYALPISIRSEQIKVNPELQTTLFLVRAAP